jgi:glucokinase
MTMTNVLGFDVGGTKTSWGLFSQEGDLLKNGQYATPQDREEFLEVLVAVAKPLEVSAIGIGIAGTTSADHEDVVVCPNIPSLSHFQLVSHLKTELGVPVTLDNDARCALIGEVWQGAAHDTSSTVLITIGTGIGGAVMQKGAVLLHPTDINQEISHLVVDPSNLLETSSGRGTVEALLGGKNLEERFGIPVGELVSDAREGKEEAIGVFRTVSHYFKQCLQVIHMTYNCRQILVGGKGCKDLDLYLQDTPPCPVHPAKLGELAGLYGAARLALDVQEMLEEEDAEWGDAETSDVAGTDSEA